MPVLLAAAVVGAGLSLYGQISAANAQADAMRKSADLKRQQANELLERQAINEQIIREQAFISGKRYSSAVADTGGAGTGIGGIMEINKAANDQINLTRRDAEFKARMLRSGANIESTLASDQIKAAWISGAGSILSSGASAYSMMKGPSTPQSLPNA